MEIAVIGTGYVGLVAGTCFAETGNKVTCVDINPEKIAKLKSGQPTIFEPGLKELMQKNQNEGRLHFTTDLKSAAQSAQVIFLAVGTPSSEDGSADLTAVQKVCEDVAKAISGPKVVVNKSTVPVGTAQKVRDIFKAHAKFPVEIVSNPEFLKEGSALDDFLKPDRVVIGTASDNAWNTMVELYEPFVRQGNPIIRMSNVSAEMTKYAANSLLATKISFINEVALLCDAVGADVESVRAGITSDVRIGKHFLYPGPGYGGSCFPKDVKALLKTASNVSMPLYVIDGAEKANARQKQILGKKMETHFGGMSSLQNKTIAIWGMAFKPNTDDMREAPALVLVDFLLNAGAKVQAFDPVAKETTLEALHSHPKAHNFHFSTDAYLALEGADALALVTEWHEFRNPDFAKMIERMKSPVIFDGRNIWKPENIRAKGFTYYSMGRSTNSN